MVQEEAAPRRGSRGEPLSGGWIRRRARLRKGARQAGVGASAAASVETTPAAWAHWLELLGLLAGLAGWVALIGGAKLWARLYAADVPPMPTLARLDRQWLLAEGFITLAAPILLGGLVAVLAYYSRPGDHPWSGATAPERSAGTARQTRAPRPWLLLCQLSEDLGGVALAASALVVGVVMLLILLALAEAAWLILGAACLPALTLIVVCLGSRDRLRLVRPRPRITMAAGALVALCLGGIVLVTATLPWDGEQFAKATGIAAGLTALAGWGLAFVAWQVGLPKPGSGVPQSVSEVEIGRAFHQASNRALGACLLDFVFGVGLALSWSVGFWWVLVMVVLTLLAVWVTLGAVLHLDAGKTSLALFVAILLWSGALAFVQEIGDRNPDLLRVHLMLTDGTSLDGYLAAQTKEAVFLATPLAHNEDLGRQVDVVDSRRIREVTYLGRQALPEGEICQDGSDAQLRSECTDQVRSPERPRTGSQAPPGPTPTDHPPEPTRFDPEEPTTPSPRVTVRARRDATFSGTRVQFQVLSLVRQGGYLLFDARLAHVAGPTVRYDAVLPELTGRRLADMAAFDTRARREYDVSRRDDGRCACTEVPGASTLGPGDYASLAGSFEVPERVGGPMDLRVPGFGWLRDVKID